MLLSIANIIRDIVAGRKEERPRGDIIHKYVKTPEDKPPRANNPTENISNRPEYHQEDMRERRMEDPKYQIVSKPDILKEFNKKTKQKIKERFNI